jgi:hypothetical protein
LLVISVWTYLLPNDILIKNWFRLMNVETYLKCSQLYRVLVS